MPRARRQDDPARQKPLTIAALKEHGAFEDFTVPGSFDPGAAWTHTYSIWLVGRVQQRDWGSLRLERGTPANGTVALKVAVSVKQATGATQETTGEIECRSDALCTPSAWEISSAILDSESRPIDGTRVEQSAVVASRGVEVTVGGVTRLLQVPAPFTSNWSLFDAVQRLPREDTQPLDFALLEDLELVKRDHRLSFRETTDFDFGAGSQAICGYHQIGAGVLPYHYWVDEHGRLLVALSGVRAYILDSTA